MSWIKDHLPRWVDLSHDQPWNSKESTEENEKVFKSNNS